MPATPYEIRNIPVFSTLTAEEVKQAALETDIREYRRGEIIYRERNHIHGIFAIHTGILKIYKTGMEGKEQIVKFVKQGDIIGFRSVLSGDLACTTAEMLEDGILEYIPKSVLLNLMQNNFMFTAALIRLICRELGEANEFIAIALPTGLGVLRNAVLVRCCDAVVAVRGAYGTLSEIAFALRMAVPVVGLDTWSVARNGQTDPGIHVAGSPRDAVRMAVELARKKIK